ncbi:MAG: hypothetical protein Q7K98_07270 [Candidatus Omnitrophota bacterium]|nr:hypothetical protein [Candidatus Omnitrophota bacterium]
MRKALLASSGIVFCFFLCGASGVYAQQGEDSSVTNVGQEISSDKQQIKDQRQEISRNAQASRAEEASLRQQIKAALDAGDRATANQLRGQLKAAHQENVLEKQQDIQSMRDSRNELKADVNQARQEGFMHPQANAGNNPPGPAGGPGAGPNRGTRMDRDNNPPGPVGGQGSNWENRPGPQGGPGASPNIRPQGSNPPGPQGGPGVSRGNPPGPRGGAGSGRNAGAPRGGKSGRK